MCCGCFLLDLVDCARQFKVSRDATQPTFKHLEQEANSKLSVMEIAKVGAHFDPAVS